MSPGSNPRIRTPSGSSTGGQLAHDLEVVPRGQPPGGRVVGVRPGLERAAGPGVGEQRLEQLGADAGVALVGVDAEVDLVLDEQPEALGAHPAADVVGTHPDLEQGGLVERAGAVRGLRAGGDVQDLAGLLGCHTSRLTRR